MRALSVREVGFRLHPPASTHFTPTRHQCHDNGTCVSSRADRIACFGGGKCPLLPRLSAVLRVHRPALLARLLSDDQGKGKGERRQNGQNNRDPTRKVSGLVRGAHVPEPIEETSYWLRRSETTRTPLFLARLPHSLSHKWYLRTFQSIISSSPIKYRRGLGVGSLASTSPTSPPMSCLAPNNALHLLKR